MQYQINDETVTTQHAPTVAEVVETHVGTRDGVAVAVDGTVVPRSRWEDVSLSDGARVDVLTAVQGG